MRVPIGKYSPGDHELNLKFGSIGLYRKCRNASPIVLSILICLSISGPFNEFSAPVESGQLSAISSYGPIN